MNPFWISGINFDEFDLSSVDVATAFLTSEDPGKPEAIRVIKYQEPVLTIGDYTIRQHHNGNIWIQHESGEGGEMNLESFEKMYKEWL